MPARAFAGSRLDELSRHQNLLLLQGPNGPFFKLLADRLRELGASVTKINFNGGDSFFYRDSSAIRYRDSFEAWPAFLRFLIEERNIRAIVLFGQCRPMHQIALSLARETGVSVAVFEEGYVRPWWITMEIGGVNHASQLASVVPATLPIYPQVQRPRSFRWGFTRMAWYSFLYFAAGLFAHRLYPRYEHHKPFGSTEMFRWLRSAYRKHLYRSTEREIIASLLDTYGPDFFFVPLQISTDSQITHASNWKDNDAFIKATIRSFAAHACESDLLVFKHHPLERGHADYATAINASAEHCGVAGRVLYIHDGHVPSLLKRSKGVVTINSTVGLQALYHGVPVCVTGSAFYARPGIVEDVGMDDFWQEHVEPNRKYFTRFYRYMMHTTQINASFYVTSSLRAPRREFGPGVLMRFAGAGAAMLLFGSGEAPSFVQKSVAWLTYALHAL
ncbi:capsular biosynthesis protein [Caballeronia sp. LZ029]|uniref:capsule biosynthesis protein n=1 Tax=Caballeronia sp. LZ029 TaxID=3038564 RepID=UPI0028669BF6|nr:capsular biosynthesis protein [Caballeronia sp. LZ029]MDR5744494.1 capsular biosynthesis protein [Caballeronia sp. LZ029]